MTLKLLTRVAPKTNHPTDATVALGATLVDEAGNEALATSGLVAALGTLTVAEITALATVGSTVMDAVADLSVDEVLANDASVVQAIVPTADGTTTAIIAAKGRISVCTVASTDANHWIVLPAPTPGNILILLGNATIYEMRSSAPATVGIGGNTPTANHESAVPASAICVVICLSATNWEGLTIVGGVLAALEKAA